MKKICLILVCVMMLTLCACGSGEPASTLASTSASTESTPAPAPEATPEVEEPSVEPSQEPAEETPDTEPEESLKDIAMGFVGKELAELIAAIGEPESSDYAPSCLGDGEDGNLYYDGFTVYTYREGGVETVEYVE